MKIFIPVLFIIMGVVFLLVSAVFYQPFSNCLLGLQQQSGSLNPPGWNLALVLQFVRVIFIIVEIFLCGFGAALVWLEKVKGYSLFGS
ncbi:MAG: hypothetical protein JW954_07925 [Dehalococcoidaceae bacterium]|nr:hypothetical protein [Dehalococcoidaceae bacterium]